MSQALTATDARQESLSVLRRYQQMLVALRSSLVPAWNRATIYPVVTGLQVPQQEGFGEDLCGTIGIAHARCFITLKYYLLVFRLLIILIT